MSKLPPGPWRVERECFGRATKVVDAEGCEVLAAVDTWGGLLIEASPEILRAIEALPTLAEAARGISRFLGAAEFDEHIEVVALRRALELLDASSDPERPHP